MGWAPMTRDITPDLQQIRLFLTEPHRCSYLPDQKAVTAFVDPQLTIDAGTYNRLSGVGFRRSGQYIYTPRCTHCKACIPVRIPAAEFLPNRQQRRTLKRNQDVQIDIVEQIDVDRHYPLYERYIEARHRDGDMHPPSKKQYQDFIGNPWECTRFMEFSTAGRLLGCAVVDYLDTGLSAIYTYFDPDQARRGLGTFSILSQVRLAREQSLDYVYLGYWVRNCGKMNYKSKFRPAELYLNNRWLKL